MLGTPVCKNCEKTKKRLFDAFGVTVVKVVINLEDEQHLRIVNESKAAGYTEAPIIAYQHEDDTLEWITSGMSRYAEMKTDHFIEANIVTADA